jgi:hypothetical protein
MSSYPFEITYYDANNQIVGSKYALVEINILKPGEKCSFPSNVPFSDKNKVVKSFSINLEKGIYSANATYSQPYRSFSVSNDEWVDGLFYDDYVKGKITNTGSTVKKAVIAVTVYDNNNKIIGDGYTISDPISAGQTVDFKIGVDWDSSKTYSRHAILVDSYD